MYSKINGDNNSTSIHYHSNIEQNDDIKTHISLFENQAFPCKRYENPLPCFSFQQKCLINRHMFCFKIDLLIMKIKSLLPVELAMA